MSSNKARIERVARTVFGYEQLRPGQQEVIQAVLQSQDTLAVMPTGLGKSAVYQIAGVLKAGPTVVVSPLLALQRDQLESIAAQELGGAAAVNSAVGVAAARAALEDAEAGDLEFIFMTPEQFSNPEKMAHLQAARPSLFVVDEAHCVSEWGHSFRPDYLNLAAVIEQLGHPTVLALTATASPPVRQEIVERLKMQSPRVLVHGFDRPNIALQVKIFHDEPSKKRALLEYLEHAQRPGIIYVATRKHAEAIADLLKEHAINAQAYHAGMRTADREATQTAFMHDEIEVIVATTAFGMGIDKPDVRFVLHYDVSDSIDSYYQEIGRAGRDGEPAEALLLYRPEDLGLRRFFAGAGQLDLDELTSLVEAIQTLGQGGAVAVQELKVACDISDTRLQRMLHRLEEAGLIELQAVDGTVQLSRDAVDREEAIAAAMEAQQHRRQFDQSRVSMMQGYAELRHCRRQYLLNYFGEEASDRCGSCDICAAAEDSVSVPVESIDQPFPINSRVIHTLWGEGQVLRYEEDKMVVLFDSVGYKNLAVDLVIESALLQAV